MERERQADRERETERGETARGRQKVENGGL